VALLSATSRRALAAGALAALAALAGCIGTNPGQAEADALGPDPSGLDEGPLHRAGFPCTRCHGEAWWQEDPVFELAGTVYRQSGDTRGLDGEEQAMRGLVWRERSCAACHSGDPGRESNGRVFTHEEAP
jgi:hypothetical protein